MARTEYGIAVGSGGEILDVPENEELLERLRATPVLPPAALLKLGAYYQGYVTNRPLANHLQLVAMFDLAGNREIRDGLLKALGGTKTAAASPADDPWDYWEDYFDGKTDEATETGGALFSVRYIPFPGSNLGLLIETPHSKHHHKQRYFIIGIAPASASL